MSAELSSNAQAILLLTAPLIVGRNRPSINPLTASEYRGLARRLRELKQQPADLLEPRSMNELTEWGFDLDTRRLFQLLGRGFLLAQAMERWRARAIWVLSRADSGYPPRLKKRLGEDAPPILYGCGGASILNTGGLAVVGSRSLTDMLIEDTEAIGKLTAYSQQTLVSGGARGTDQAAMRGALEAGGRVVGVLGDSLEKAVMKRDYRDALMNGRLALICPYDPAARFQVGHAMRRNKLIYAVADAALVVNSDYGKGGTWTGAVEQLDKLRLVPIYVRSHGVCEKGLNGLRERGAIPWPNPKTPETLEMCLQMHAAPESRLPRHESLSARERDEPAPPLNRPQDTILPVAPSFAPAVASGPTAAEDLFATVTMLLASMDGPRTEVGVAKYLNVSKPQAGAWLKRFIETKIRELFKRTDELRTEAEVAEVLRVTGPQIRSSLKRLVEEGIIERVSRPRPARYRCAGSIGSLFDLDD